MKLWFNTSLAKVQKYWATTTELGPAPQNLNRLFCQLQQQVGLRPPRRILKESLKDGEIDNDALRTAVIITRNAERDSE